MSASSSITGGRAGAGTTATGTGAARAVRHRARTTAHAAQGVFRFLRRARRVLLRAFGGTAATAVGAVRRGRRRGAAARNLRG